MTPSPAPRRSLLLKALAVLAKILGGAALLAAFAVIIREQIPWTFADPGAGERWQRVALTAVTIAALLLGLRHCFRRPRPTPRALACFLIGAVAGWTWLVWDDPKLDFPPEDYLTAPDSPEAEATHVLVLRYRNDDKSALAGLPELREPVAQRGNQTPTNEQWTTFVTAHRAEIQRGWEQLADHRAWIAEMAAAPELADFITEFNDPIPSFRHLRASARFMTWQARALALEGRGDEALDKTATLLEASQKLVPESRTLVRGMIAIVLQKMALRTATFVLDSAETSPEARARLLAVVSSRPDAATSAFNLMWCEYPLACRAMMDFHGASEGMPAHFRFFSPLYTPRATANLHASIMRDLGEKAARRDLDALKDIDSRHSDAPTDLRLKNWPGRLMIAMVVPAFAKVTEQHWFTEDLAADLETRLRAP